MDSGAVIKYSASAGSGKTHALAREYLLRLLSGRHDFHRILAVTFTNKAAAEMKRRILDELYRIASGNFSSLSISVMKDIDLQPAIARDRAVVLLNSILADYTGFAVGTIDSFFQKVFRAFAREIGVESNFQLYVDHGEILSDAVDDLLFNLNDNQSLRKWLVEYAGILFDDGRGLNIREMMVAVSGAVFSEKYKLLPEDIRNTLSDRSNVGTFAAEMKSIADSFRKELRDLGLKAVEVIDSHGVCYNDFAGGSRGVGAYLKKVSEGRTDYPGATFLKAVREQKWAAGKASDPTAVAAAAAGGVADCSSEIVGLFERRYREFVTAEIIRSNLYMAAILGDVVRAVRERTSSENSFVLADTGDLLMKVMEGDQTPFIYEKTGSAYDFYMIDEFQDTSLIQYYNFRPLIDNTLAMGGDTLVVGDVKQSIYRWRNGDWRILDHSLERDFGEERVSTIPLKVNWRSGPGIVSFNNSLFTALTEMFDSELRESEDHFSFSSLYRDVRQSTPAGREGGYVYIEFLKGETTDENDSAALSSLTEIVMRCQDDGYSASDIGILVRKNQEAATVTRYLSDYSITSSHAGRYNFNVVSDESLYVGNSHTVRFIVSAMVRVTEPGNILNRALMLRYYALLSDTIDINGISILSGDLDSSEKAHYPAGYESLFSEATSLSLFELSERIIEHFDLATLGRDSASLNFFHDQILNFMRKRGSSVGLFTDWWLKEGHKKGIVVSGALDAISVMTIHKSKGLQFPVVIMPFISWDFSPGNRTSLWVTPSERPWNRVGAFPVDYSSRLEESLFPDEYYREKRVTLLDNINLLYVAFTRAADRLYGFAYGRNRNCAGNIVERLFKMPDTAHSSGSTGSDLCGSASLSSGYDSESNLFVSGHELSRQGTRAKSDHIDAGYPLFSDRGRLRLSLYSRERLSTGDEPAFRGLRYGTLLHEIFRNIREKGDAERAVKKAFLAGMIEASVVKPLTAMIKERISGAGVSSWFSGDCEVLNETPVITGSGEMRRPDRVIIRGDRATIVDYKFGEPDSRDISQMKAYRRLVADMGYVVEEAALWYVIKNEIVRV